MDIVKRLKTGGESDEELLDLCTRQAVDEIIALRAKVKELTQEYEGERDTRLRLSNELHDANEQLAAMTQERNKLQEYWDATKAESEQRRITILMGQAREQQLRDGITTIAAAWSSADKYDKLFIDGLLSIKSDNSALDRACKLYAAGVLDCIKNDMPNVFASNVCMNKAEQLRKETEK